MNQPTPTQVGEFLAGLSATLSSAQKIRKICDKDLALEFNPLLTFFKIGENKLSEILAYFLNKDERHGQGSTFLDSFLKVVDLETETKGYSKVFVRTEQPTRHSRRLDIYLDFDNGRFRIGIENKIWAHDQPNQLRDYNEFLKEKDNNYCLIYLTPYNHTPGDHSISKTEMDTLANTGHYKSFDHSQGISTLLKQWINDCRADKVRTFLKDLYQQIQHTINGEKFMGQNDLVADYIMASKQNLDTALAVQASMDTVMDLVFEKLKKQIIDLSYELDCKFIDFTMERSSKPWTHFTFRILSDINPEIALWFRFQFEEIWNEGLIWGIITNGKEQPEVAKILNEYMGMSDGSTKAWAWWKWDDKKNWNTETFLEIYNGTYIQKVKAILLRYIPLVKQAIDSNPSIFWKTPID